jgi:hypothetical protein
MKGHKKKEKSVIDPAQEIEENVHELLEAIVQDSTDRASSMHEAFEIYTHQLHSHLYTDLPIFRENFIKGYKILLEEISHSPTL